MLKFIGTQVYQHQDNVIIEMGLPTINHNPSPITPSTSNLNIVENDGLLELVTDPNSTIRIQHGNSGWSFTANEQGRTSIGRLENGVYLVSVNNSEPEPVVLAKAEEYQWVSYHYYAPDNYIIRVDGDQLPGYYDKWVGLYDAEDNELYRTIMDKNINRVDITYTVEDSPGLLEPGQYRITMETLVQDFTLEPGNNTDILSFRYNNYLDYNIRIRAPCGSQVHLQGPVTYTYDADESLSVNLVSEGWGPDLPEGSYTVDYVFNGVSSNPVNLDLVGRPFQDLKLEYFNYYREDKYDMGLTGEPFSRIVIDNNLYPTLSQEYPHPMPASGQIVVDSLSSFIRLYSGEAHDIYTYNRDWTSNRIRIEIP